MIKKQLLVLTLVMAIGMLFCLQAGEFSKSIIPTNVNVECDSNTVLLEWDNVSGVSKYYIYSEDVPDGALTLEDTTITNSWTGNFTDEKKFFVITSEIPPPVGMVLLPGGTFQMGDHLSEGYSNELPVHSVSVGSFYMGAFEITQAEWALYMPTETYDYGVGDNHPVYYVSWYEIMVYCNKRSIAEGINPCYTISSSTDPDDWGVIPTAPTADPVWDAAICNWSASGYRLPSEAEWEYAARGGLTGQRFPNGATISQSINADTQANFFATTYLVYDLSPTSGSHPDYGSNSSPVGSFPANGYGLYDMSGNVWEWCWDWYDESYYSTCNDLGTVNDPYGPTTSSTNRVLRSGYWTGNAKYSRIAYRNSLNYPFSKIYNGGFRLSRTP